jgi:hypothetical protein
MQHERSRSLLDSRVGRNTEVQVILFECLRERCA